MKNLTHLERTCLVCCILVGLPIWALGEQVTNRTTERFFGVVTNGYRGEIELVSLNGQPVELGVLVTRVDDTNGSVANLSFNQRGRILDGMITNNWDYWMATNSFCGPIAVHDANGRLVPLLKPDTSSLTNYRGMEIPLSPDVASTNAYPFTYNLAVENARHFRQFKHYSGPGIFPVPLFFPSPRSELARFALQSPSATKVSTPVPTILNRRFQLGEYFDIGAPGEYSLTVWPKIYRRVSPNDDLCERIDIPPVNVTIRTQHAATDLQSK